MTRRQVWSIIVAALAVVIVAAGLTAVIVSATTSTNIRDTQETNTAKSDARDEALKLVKDCVETRGECYKRNQRNLASAVGNITDANAVAATAAASCAKDFPNRTFEMLLHCTVKRVKLATASNR